MRRTTIPIIYIAVARVFVWFEVTTIHSLLKVKCITRGNANTDRYCRSKLPDCRSSTVPVGVGDRVVDGHHAYAFWVASPKTIGLTSFSSMSVGFTRP